MISLANNCKNLEDLDVGEIGFVANQNWENAFMALLQKRQNTLKSLSLSITGDEFKFRTEWFQTLSLCSNLEKLSLHFFHDEMNYGAINSISRLSNLQELHLDVRNISANKSFELFSNGKLKKLKILHLGKYGNGQNKRFFVHNCKRMSKS